MQLVTGYTGVNHVSAQDDSIRNVMLGEFGGRGVFPVLNEFEATAITANEVRVYSGYGINQGRLFKIDRNAYDSLTIENGTAGTKRADLIVARYIRDEQTGIEGCNLVVIKGTAGSEYVDPSYTTGNILEGALQDDMLMYRVRLNGVAIEGIDELFTTYRSLIGGIEPVVSAQVDADFDSKLASYQTRFENMITADHNANVNQQTLDHNAYTQMMNDDDSAFDTWFAQIQTLIDEQTATRLANAIAKHDTNFASVEASTTASKAYAVGDLLVYQNNLYKVTTAIASGGTINTASGGNVAKCSIAEVIDEVETMVTGMNDGYVGAGRKANTTNGSKSTAEGNNTTAGGNGSHAEGYQTVAGDGTVNKENQHAEGQETVATGDASHAEGCGTQASGNYSHAEGIFTSATNESSHAEGSGTQATGDSSHAEGHNTVANNNYAHAEGSGTQASGYHSHAEGSSTKALGSYSHAEGSFTVAGSTTSGVASHAEGEGTKALSNYQHVSGKYNTVDNNNTYAVIVGNGTGDETANRSNALTLDWGGNLKATSYSNLSSRKYKENIKDMTEEEARKILELNPVSYDYIRDNMPNGQFGLIAEDVEPIMTYPLVYENDEVDSIDYSKFVPALIRMVQIQQKEIDSLKEALKK